MSICVYIPAAQVAGSAASPAAGPPIITVCERVRNMQEEGEEEEGKDF